MLLHTESILGETKGSKTEAGLFIDFGPIRLFGNWFRDDETSTFTGSTSTVLTNTVNTGLLSGIKIFF